VRKSRQVVERIGGSRSVQILDLPENRVGYRDSLAGHPAPSLQLPEFQGELATMLKYLGSELIRTAYRSPWQNGVAERWVGSWRRELLDHVIVLNESHLRQLLRDVPLRAMSRPQSKAT
jgi:hypothetical protein